MEEFKVKIPVPFFLTTHLGQGNYLDCVLRETDTENWVTDDELHEHVYKASGMEQDMFAEIIRLRKMLRESRETISQLKKSLGRQYRYNQDYVPYPDEDDRR